MINSGSPFWANLLHLSTNMWLDRPGPEPNSYSPRLRCDDDLWVEMTQRMADVGCTMVVIDVGDGIEYRSRPEISVRDAWSQGRLGDELARLRELGLEPVPKLNFSATHDAWLGEYATMVSSKPYYQVCRELIMETAELFGRPRFFHLGMDEESAENQEGWQLAITRQHDLWWHDLELLVGAVELAGSRAWIWSDRAWSHPDSFYSRMSTRVLQSNWYYRNGFVGANESTRPSRLVRGEEYVSYLDLDDHGYDQVPTGSNWLYRDNLARTVAFTRRRLDPERVLGFLQTSWRPTLPAYRERLIEAIDGVASAIAQYSDQGGIGADEGE